MESGLSVVMATLGGDLTSVFMGLNSSSKKPDEIIVCLPNKNHRVNIIIRKKITTLKLYIATNMGR